MYRFLSIVGLEFYALFLAWLQSFGGVRTDEAKMLLNISYPHPPLLRWIVNQTEIFPFQEMLWRVLLATIVVQAVWLVWRAGIGLLRGPRVLVCASWLCSAAVLLQAGSITTAPVTAVWGLVFCCFFVRLERETLSPRGRGYWKGVGMNSFGFPLFIAFLWFLSLFTAYQAVLYCPLVIAILRQRRVSWGGTACSVGIPVFLVGLYTLGNPLSLDRFVDAGTLNVGKSLLQKFSELGDAALVGGSIIGTMMGLYGISLMRARALSFSLLLVAAFIFLSFRSYYAILFTPLFTGGVILFLREHPELWKKIGLAYILVLMFLHPFPVGLSPSPARLVVQVLAEAGVEGDILINGSFGHEWQYESRWLIRRYRPEFLQDAGAVVCLDPCEGIGDSWRKLEDVSVDVWMR